VRSSLPPQRIFLNPSIRIGARSIAGQICGPNIDEAATGALSTKQAALGPNTARAASASAGCEAMVAVAGQRRDGPAASNWRRNSTVVTRRRRVRKFISSP
jgi:hypothetical protein